VKCTLCKAVCRSRTIAVVLDAGKLKSACVCASCRKGGVHLVAAPQAKAVAWCKCGSGRAATRCEVCARDTELKPDAVRKALAKYLRKLAATYRGGLCKDNAEGLEQAADIVEKHEVRP
jgi:hypothetical protein